MTVRHLTRAELEAGLESIRNSPSDEGVGGTDRVAPAPERARGAGTGAARSRPRGWSATAGEPRIACPNPETQLNVMNARVIALIAQDKARWPLAGDQLFVDLDLADENLPPGSRIEIGGAVIEVSAEPHTGMRQVRPAIRRGRDEVRQLAARPAASPARHQRARRPRRRGARRRHRAQERLRDRVTSRVARDFTGRRGSEAPRLVFSRDFTCRT